MAEIGGARHHVQLMAAIRVGIAPKDGAVVRTAEG